nr:hypothetical protein [uncultured Steroidobacter sp.]
MSGKGFAFLIVCLLACSASTLAATPDSSCPISSTASPVAYGRLHQIPTVAREDDVSHTIVTPGGMVLRSPEMVAATDVLTVAARDPDAMCFHLITLAKDWHKCDIAGVARKDAENSYLFTEGSVAVRFHFTSEEQVEVAPLGTAYRSRCEPSGSIERATYTLGAQSK